MDVSVLIAGEITDNCSEILVALRGEGFFVHQHPVLNFNISGFNGKFDLALIEFNNEFTIFERKIAKLVDTLAIPLIVLGRLNDEFYKISALRIGAADYMAKPFSNKEVIARIYSIVRILRFRESKNPYSRFGSLLIDSSSYGGFIVSNGTVIDLKLSKTEFEILSILISAPYRVFCRMELIEYCFPEKNTLERTIDTHVRNIRRKFHSAGEFEMLKSVRGFGYKLLDKSDNLVRA